MSDLFEEVEENLRSDRYRALARKARHGCWRLRYRSAGCPPLASGVGNSIASRPRDKASRQYAAALTAFVQGDPAKATQLWGDVAKSPAKAYQALALMQLGGVKMASGKPDDVKAAVALFDQAAAAAADDMLGDAARLKIRLR